MSSQGKEHISVKLPEVISSGCPQRWLEKGRGVKLWSVRGRHRGEDCTSV